VSKIFPQQHAGLPIAKLKTELVNAFIKRETTRTAATSVQLENGVLQVVNNIGAQNTVPNSSSRNTNLGLPVDSSIDPSSLLVHCISF